PEVPEVIDLSQPKSIELAQPAPEMPQEFLLDSLPSPEPPPIFLDAPPVSEDDLLTSSPDLMLEEIVAASPFENAQETPVELAPSSVETELPEEPTMATPDVELATAAKLAELNRTSKETKPPYDHYGLGVRLMRVSPLWLLLAGLSFISFIVLCNWLIKPGETAAEPERTVAAARSQATNQPVSRLAGSSTTAQTPATSAPAQQTAEKPVAFVPTEAKTASQPVAAPSVESVKVKQTPPASSSNASNESKTGKVTIQIGSYNEAGQAEARVADLKSAGFEARVVEVEIPKRGTWYRVQSGRFETRDDAERYGKQLREKGVASSFITTDVQ
ncbi:MAG TPA: SPOR domain-containing protein, partial [Pyrinomonadaceae bacterium]|nr:SPOR domain-containing protein [Pyrinomonadaceae bacterium]